MKMPYLDGSHEGFNSIINENVARKKANEESLLSLQERGKEMAKRSGLSFGGVTFVHDYGVQLTKNPKIAWMDPTPNIVEYTFDMPRVKGVAGHKVRAKLTPWGVKHLGGKLGSGWKIRVRSNELQGDELPKIWLT
jgi:hypothetical protein